MNHVRSVSEIYLLIRQGYFLADKAESLQTSYIKIYPGNNLYHLTNSLPYWFLFYRLSVEIVCFIGFPLDSA